MDVSAEIDYSYIELFGNVGETSIPSESVIQIANEA